MSEKRSFIWMVLIPLFGVLLQFLAFRVPAIYELAFKTHLFDIAWWVEEPAEVLVMGGSAAMNDVMPNEIESMHQLTDGSILNLGMNGATILETKIAYLKYVDRFGHPECVYFVISPTFYYENFLFKKNFEKIYLNLEQWMTLQNEGYANHYFFPIALFFKSIELHQDYNFRDYHFDLASTRKSHGFQYNASVAFSKEITPRFVPRKDEVFGLADELLDSLREWVNLLDKNQVKLILLLAPFHEVLYQDHKKHPDRFDDLFVELNEIFGERVILGSFNPADFMLRDSHFLNLDHLSSSGAEVYTKAIFKNYPEHKSLPKRKLFNSLR